MLEARFLGKFDIRSDGESVELPARKAQSLLAYLMMMPGTMHRREQLAGFLWPDSDEATARSRLRYALWQLRKAIGEEYFITDKISIAFNQEMDFWLDCASLQAFETEPLTTDDLAHRLKHYVGEFLPGFYDDWVLLTRDQLHANFEQMMVLLLGGLSAEKRWVEVLEWAERWISLGTPSEPAYQALMVAHAKLGDKAGATNAYQRCRRSLDEQLGVEPADLTEKIYRQIIDGEPLDPSQIFPSSTLPTTPSITQPSRKLLRDSDGELFVTRESELSWLDKKLELILSGGGQVAFVVGDAGQGKTALLSEFSRRTLQSRNDLVVAKGSSEAFTGFGDPYLPFREILASLTGDGEIQQSSRTINQENAKRLWNLIPASVQALVDHGPDLIDNFVPGEALLRRASAYSSRDSVWLERLKKEVKRRKGRPVPLNIDHGDSRKDLFEQYTRVIQTLSNIHPLLLLLDDLQWADIGTIGLLFHLARRIEGHRVFILGAYRQDDIAQLQDGLSHPLTDVLAELKRIFGETQVDLDQATEIEGRRFIDDFLDSEPNSLDEAFRQALFMQTAGQPLFTVELLRQMQGQGDIYKDEEGKWVNKEDLDWEFLPAKVEAVIERRIGRLPPALREIANAASIQGEEFTAEVIAAVLNQEDIDIIHQLSQDLDKQHQLIEARGIKYVGGQRLSIYQFRHILFQKFIYEELDPVERAHLHQRVGEDMENVYGEHKVAIAGRLARQFEEAGVKEKAIAYLLLAGKHARQVSANEQAVAYLGKGLALLKDLPSSKERDELELELQIASGAPKVATLGYASRDVELTYERARELCKQTGDLKRLAPALWGLCTFYQVRGNHSTAYEMAKQIQEIAGNGKESGLMLLAHWMLGTTLTHLGEFSSARDNLELALSKYAEDPDPKLTYTYGQNPAVTCLNYLAINLWVLGYLDEALQSCDRAISIANKIEHPYSLAFAHGMAGLLHAIRRDEEKTFSHCEQTLKYAKESSFPFFLAVGMNLRGWTRVKSGKTGLGIKLMQNGIEAMQLIGSELGQPFFLSLLAEGYSEGGDIRKGLEIIETALKKAEGSSERWFSSGIHWVMGNLIGKQAKAGANPVVKYQKAVEIANQQKAKSFELRAAISLVECGEDDQLLKQVYQWIKGDPENDLLAEASALVGLGDQKKKN